MVGRWTEGRYRADSIAARVRLRDRHLAVPDCGRVGQRTLVLLRHLDLRPEVSLEARSVYRSCLEMLKEKTSYKTSDAIVDEDTFLQEFLQSAERTAMSLQGIEESSLTRRFALEMPSRIYQLKTLAPILRKNLPSELALPFKAQGFDWEAFRALLASCEARPLRTKGWLSKTWQPMMEAVGMAAGRSR